MDTYRYIWKIAVTCDSMYGLAKAHLKKLYLLVSLCLCKLFISFVYLLVHIENRDKTTVLPPEQNSLSVKFSSQVLIRDDSNCGAQVLP